MPNKRAKFDTWSFDEPVKSLSTWNTLSNVDLSVKGPSFQSVKGFGLIFECYYGSALVENEARVNETLSIVIKETNNESESEPKAGSMTPTLRIKTMRFVGVALGKAEEVNHKTGTALGKAIASRCIDEASSKVEKAMVHLPFRTFSPDFLKELSVAFYSSLYADQRFRGTLTSIKPSKVPAEHLKTLHMQYNNGESLMTDDNVKAIEEGKQIAAGVYLARDIVNAPHSVLNSLSLADLARKIASESDGCLTCQILDKEECEKRGMGAYLGVARASETPPQFIHLTYSPPGKAKRKIGVVGKGLLFDTGGYNIKTATMELMKFDCGGAAAVLGAAKSISKVKPPGVECHFVVAACENMINAKGIVPSDVLVASNGVTIEVLNTDAEGRLTLADALVYCDQELECEKIIELSTLTGACMVALGKVRLFVCEYLYICLFICLIVYQLAAVRRLSEFWYFR